jgi:hypothetical protein
MCEYLHDCNSTHFGLFAKHADGFNVARTIQREPVGLYGRTSMKDAGVVVWVGKEPHVVAVADKSKG